MKELRHSTSHPKRLRSDIASGHPVLNAIQTGSKIDPKVCALDRRAGTYIEMSTLPLRLLERIDLRSSIQNSLEKHKATHRFNVPLL